MINLGPYSGKNCPNVRYRPGIVDRALEITALLILLATWGCIYWLCTQGVSFPSLQVMGGMAVLVFFIIGACAYAPVRLVNFPVRVNEQNIAVQYLLAVRLLRVMNVILSLFFLSGSFLNYYKLAPVFWGISLTLLFIAFAVYLVLAFKYK